MKKTALCEKHKTRNSAFLQIKNKAGATPIALRLFSLPEPCLLVVGVVAVLAAVLIVVLVVVLLVVGIVVSLIVGHVLYLL